MWTFNNIPKAEIAKRYGVQLTDHRLSHVQKSRPQVFSSKRQRLAPHLRQKSASCSCPSAPHPGQA